MNSLELPGLLAKYVMSDFESNIRTQFQRIFPGLRWKNYLFHFVKAIIGGMKIQFRIPQNSMLRSLVRSAMSLPFVPIKKMKKAMKILSGIVAELPTEEQIRFGKKFIDYIERQWMKDYDPELQNWNFYSKKGSYTNNPRYVMCYFSILLVGIVLLTLNTILAVKASTIGFQTTKEKYQSTQRRVYNLEMINYPGAKTIEDVRGKAAKHKESEEICSQIIEDFIKNFTLPSIQKV